MASDLPSHRRLHPTRYAALMVDPTDSREQRILAVLDDIPPGHLATYGQVALEAGLPRRARWVGRILSELGPSSALPWHRVVSSTGRISDRSGDGPSEQARRLRAEGIPVSGTGRVDLASYRWTPS